MTEDDKNLADFCAKIEGNANVGAGAPCHYKKPSPALNATNANDALFLDPTINLCGSCVVWSREAPGKVLMVSRKEDRTKFCLPGGKIDPSDWTCALSAEHASAKGALRELYEETGACASINHLERIMGTADYADGHKHNRFVTLYLVKDWYGVIGTKEPIDVKWDYPAEVIKGPFGDLYTRLFDQLSKSGAL